MQVSLNHTHYGLTRMAQRGFVDEDLSLIMLHGTNVDDNIVMITNADRDRIVGNLKSQIRRIERLNNKKVVVGNGSLITVYHSTKSDQKKAMRRKRSCF